VGDDGKLFGVGVVPHLTIPTGSSELLLGRTGFSGGGSVALTGELGQLTLSGNGGLSVEPEVSWRNADGGDRWLLGAHTGWLIDDRSGVNVEFHSSLAMQPNEVAGAGSPAELLASVRRRGVEGPWYTLGAATAVTPGIGAAAFRVFIGAGWGDKGVPGPPDLDEDGLVDRVDSCPEEPETANDYLDADGCPDVLPTVVVDLVRDGEPAEPTEIWLTREGREPEIVQWTGMSLSYEDLPGVLYTAEVEVGECLFATGRVMSNDSSAALTLSLEPVLDQLLKVMLTDVEGAPVVGAEVWLVGDEPDCGPAVELATTEVGEVASLVGPGWHTVSVQAEGFQSRDLRVNLSEDGQGAHIPMVMLESAALQLAPGSPKADQIALGRIDFEHGSAKLVPEAEPVLSELVHLLVGHTDLGVLTIVAHTDGEGDEAENMALSEQRAQVVMDALVDAGISPKRLRIRGYGATRPIATNRTPMGRAENRRIELVFDSVWVDESD
jgi:outer membrane protein OmpA-like peptidoglycan-associated protein